MIIEALQYLSNFPLPILIALFIITTILSYYTVALLALLDRWLKGGFKLNENELKQLKENIFGQFNHQKQLFNSVINEPAYTFNKEQPLDNIISSLYNLLSIMLHIPYFNIQRQQVTTFISHVEEYKDMAL